MGHPVRAEAVARESWDALFRAQGAQNPIPRIRMLDGFNEGWIDFPDGCARAIKGTTDAEAVIARLVQRAGTAIG